VGDETFAKILRRWAYPDPSTEASSDGSACRSVTTEQFIEHCERLSGLELGWFFDGYLRHARLPRLETRRDGDRLTLQWTVDGQMEFAMPIDVHLRDSVVRVETPNGRGVLVIPPGIEPVIDPDGWVLREVESL
jgi:aminopeptidase N